MKSILVTGGCGFIGSHTCLALLKENYNLIVIDSNINSSNESLKKVIKIGILEGENYNEKLTLIKGDIRNRNLISNIFLSSITKKIPIEAVIHFAGLKSVEKSIKEPLLYWENNVMGTLILLQEMEKYNCQKIVFSSSASVYCSKDLIDGKKKVCLSENSNLKPIHPYGQTKLSIERMLKNAYDSQSNKWSIINLRYFNPIGAHQTGLIGEKPLKVPDNLFPYICKVASKEINELKIYGKDWPTMDGTCIRDFIHVMDLAEAHCSALDCLFHNKSQFINLNIGTGIGTSVLELVNTFIKVNNCEVPYVFSDNRSGDVPILVADNKLAIKTLNWKPKRNIDEMCRDGWNWQKKY